MANNRLYLVDLDTRERILLAKSSGGGWWFWYGDSKAGRIDELTQWLSLRDPSASYGNTDNTPTRLSLITENEDAFSETRPTIIDGELIHN